MFCPCLIILLMFIDSSHFLFICMLHRHLMMESLTDVIKLVINLKEESHTLHLLKALPLLHLLRGDCTPFQQRVVRPSAIRWDDPCIDLTTTQQVMSSCKKGSVIYYQLIMIEIFCATFFVYTQQLAFNSTNN